MTVKELIEILSEYDRDLIVVHEGYSYDSETIDYATNDDVFVKGKYLLLFPNLSLYYDFSEETIEGYLVKK